jgi:hypothetical protein
MTSNRKRNRSLTQDEIQAMIWQDSDSDGVVDEEELVSSSDDQDYVPPTTVDSPISSPESSTESSNDESDDPATLQTVASASKVHRTANDKTRKAKNGTYWDKDPPPSSQTLNHNIVRFSQGPARSANCGTSLSSFDTFIDEFMLDEICHCTNLEARRVADQRSKKWRALNAEELRAFIGILINAGVEKSWDVAAEELFNSMESNPLYKATMSKERFCDIVQLIRFDDKRTREFRLQTDRLAAFRDIWERFLTNCRKAYIPGNHVTIDEQLVPFRGRCGFVQYMPSKPAKYGIKIFWCNDADSKYAVDAEIYVGRQPGEPVQQGLGANVVKKLTITLRNSGRNVTMDNFFTSVPLAKELLNEQLTLVGTMRKNKPDVPPVMQQNRTRLQFSSEFGFNDKVTMVSYVPKKGKAVILISTMHHDVCVDETTAKKKPEMINFYNATKGGVDCFDQMVRYYSCKRQNRRWPMILFMNMIDAAAVNAYVIHTARNGGPCPAVTHQRRLFLKDLSKKLILPHMKTRLLQTINLRISVINCMKQFGVTKPEPEPVEPGKAAAKKRCAPCGKSKDRKTRVCCNACKRPICGEHTISFCSDCK